VSPGSPSLATISVPTLSQLARICFTLIFYDVILCPVMLKPNKIKQLLALCIILAGAWLTVVIVLKTHQPKGPVEYLKALPKNVDLSLQKIHYSEIKNGEKRWELLADKVDYDKNREFTYFKKINMVIFDKGKGGHLTVTADNANYHNKSGDVELSGNVAAGNDTGMKFTTGHILFVSSRSLVTTNDRVAFADGRFVVNGVGLELMLKTKNVRILKNVTANIGARIN
jgi:LPS export ABC transporter protein LptC